MEGCNGSRGGNRRRFLQATAAAGAALAIGRPTPRGRGPGRVAGPDGHARQDRPEGHQARHGHELGPRPELRPGRPRPRASATSTRPESTRTPSPRRSSARSSNGPRCARTSTSSPRTAATARPPGDGAAKVFEQHLDASLERLKTDYVDAYYIHGIDGRRRSTCSATRASRPRSRR